MHHHASSARADELRSRIEQVHFPMSRASRRALQDAVCRFVDEAKAAGWFPERVIVALKVMAREGGVHASTRVTATDAHISDADALVMDMVAWCIERYYLPPPAEDSPRPPADRPLPP